LGVAQESDYVSFDKRNNSKKDRASVGSLPVAALTAQSTTPNSTRLAILWDTSFFPQFVTARQAVRVRVEVRDRFRVKVKVRVKVRVRVRFRVVIRCKYM
jgi:hypothetical protein